MTDADAPTTTPEPTTAPAPAPTGPVCGDCGKSANVPFTPSSDRPVYCNDCFSKRRAASPRGGPRAGGRGGFGGARGGGRAPQGYVREPKMKGVTKHGFSRFDYPGYGK